MSTSAGLYEPCQTLPPDQATPPSVPLQTPLEMGPQWVWFVRWVAKPLEAVFLEEQKIFFLRLQILCKG